MTKEMRVLEWRDEYSVGVRLLDDQHREMFRMINELVSIIDAVPNEDRITPLLEDLVRYKKGHFATEEKYFREFSYEGAVEHIAEHEKFSKTLEAMMAKHEHDSIGLAFELVDFLEDWLIGHLLNVDQKYKDCFLAHGLR